MHNYYYDVQEADGGAPPQPTPPQAPRVPLYEDPPPLTRREKKALRRARPRAWKAPVVFAIFLVLIGGAAAILLALGYGYGGFTLRLPAATAPVQGNVTTIPIYQEQEEPPTTLGRAPTGADVSIDIRPAGAEALTFQEIYQKNIPSIVSIRATKENGTSLGTGVVLTADGYIVTNYHVIQGSYKATVFLQDERTYEALLVGGDQTNDLAVLKVEAEGLAPAEFGDSEVLQVGDTALAIGNPLGEELRGTMTDGIISAMDRDVRTDGNTMTLIQTTAALNSGNSGGALLNVYGQVVGITNMKKMSKYDTIEGLGFAIPSATTKAIVDELIASGHVGGRPTLGVTVLTLTGELAESQGMMPGVYVKEVDKKAPAWSAGLRPGDIIVAADGREVRTLDELNEVKSTHAAGESMTLKIVREGKELSFQVALVEKYELDQ